MSLFFLQDSRFLSPPDYKLVQGRDPVFPRAQHSKFSIKSPEELSSDLLSSPLVRCHRNTFSEYRMRVPHDYHTYFSKLSWACPANHLMSSAEVEWWAEAVSCRAEFLRLSHAHRHGAFGEMQISIFWIWGGAWESAFLASPLVTLMLQVHGCGESTQKIRGPGFEFYFVSKWMRDRE